MQSVPESAIYTATVAGLVTLCTVVASCSSEQAAFFAQRDTLFKQGYEWQKLDTCRFAKKGTETIPIITDDGRKLVCFKLVRPSSGTNNLPVPRANDSLTTPSISELSQTSDPPPGTSGIVWKFSDN